MPIDGIMLSAVCRELQTKIMHAKVEKINQPEKDEVIFHLHCPERIAGFWFLPVPLLRKFI